MSPYQFQKKIIRFVDSGGGVSAVAKRLGVSPTFVSQVYNEKKQPSDNFIAAMGYEREIKIIVDYRLKD